jgi:hypothetical protein
VVGVHTSAAVKRGDAVPSAPNSTAQPGRAVMLKEGLHLAVATLAAVIVLNSDAHALWCSEPTEPSCISMLGISRDQFSFDLCRSEVESYLDEIRYYQQCLRDEINEKTDEANRVVEEFNCYARGGSIC